jgi:hypothetical protein
MPQPFEPMVRPFVAGDTAPATLALAPNQQVNPNTPITIFAGKTGTLGSVRTFNATYNQTVSLYMDEAIVEKTS